MALLSFEADESGAELQPTLNFESDDAIFNKILEVEEPKSFITGVAKFGSELIPGGRYLWQEERERFSKMSSGERAMAVGWEGLNALLWWKGPAIAKGAFKLIKRGAGVATKGRIGTKSLQPIEDLIDIQTKSYGDLAATRLKQKGFHKREIPSVIESARGNSSALDIKFVDLIANNKNPSLGWQKNVRVQRSPGSITYNLSPDEKLLKELAPEMLQRKAVEGSIKKQIAKVFHKDYNPRWVDGVFAKHAKKYVGGEDIMKMSDATDPIAWNVLNDMQQSQKLLLKLATPGPFASMRPVQAMFGSLNSIYGTHDDVYKVAAAGMEGKLQHGMEWTSLWNRMKAERGFGKIVSGKDRAGHTFDVFKPEKFYNKEFKEKTNEFMHKVRDMMQTVGDEQLDDAGRALAMSEKTDEVARLISNARESAPQMVDLAEAAWDFNNKLYQAGMLPEIERAFMKAGLNAQGIAVLNHSFRQIQSGRMKSIFNVMRSETDDLGKSVIDVKNPFRRNEEIKDVLTDFQDLIRHTVENPGIRENPALAVNSMFNGGGKELLKNLDGLMRDLTMKKGGAKRGFTSYTEGYFARIGKGSQIVGDDVIEGLPAEMRPFFTKQATLKEAGAPLLGFDETMAARVAAQGNAIHLYPALGEVSRNAQQYPKAIRNMVSHYVARIAGQPSQGDALAARLLNSLPGTGQWSPARVREVGGVINDFTYMGFLGIKPFSAMRNMFQPLLNVPAELGGMGDFATLFRGYAKVLKSPARRAKLRDMGIITEYAPEIMHSTGARNKLREGMMWMFRWSDEANRLVTGSAALDKWERALVKIPEIVDGKGVKAFMKASGASKRRPWIAKEIERSLTRRPHGSKIIPDMDTAERLFVRDATAVTQYLYGALDAPLITQIGGIFGRTGAIFQSWWMNYGDMIARWYTGGKPPSEIIQRSAAFATSSAIAFIAMQQMWGTGTAARTVGLGPFPKSMVIPPTWEPIFDSLGVISKAGETMFTGDTEALAKKAKAWAVTPMTFIPGGMQLKQMLRGYREDELLKSVFKIR